MKKHGQRHRVVVIGGGFAGLFAVRELARADADVTLIDATGNHLFQPLLYQVATGILSQGEIARPLRDILRKQRNASFLLGTVTAIDCQERTVTSNALGVTTVTPYDSLVVAAGASHSYFGHDGFAQDAPGLKSLDDALEIRARIFEAFEMAEAAPRREDRCRHLTFVVVGGGPTGIELAGQIAELASLSLARNYRSIDPADATVVLIESGPVLLPTFGAGLSQQTRHDLEHLGVQVHTDSRVVDVDADGVTYLSEGEEHCIPASTKIWAAGVAASPVGRLLSGPDIAVDRGGRVLVEPDCTVAGHPDVFVVGDLMSLPGVPGVAQAAIQSGRFAARTIADRIRGRAADDEFRYRDKGSLATISKARAVACLGRITLSGTPAWLVWLVVHLFTLNGYRNRVTVTIRWAVTFVLNARPERAATAKQANRTGSTPQGTESPMRPRIVPAASSPPVINSPAQM